MNGQSLGGSTILALVARLVLCSNTLTTVITSSPPFTCSLLRYSSTVALHTAPGRCQLRSVSSMLADHDCTLVHCRSGDSPATFQLVDCGGECLPHLVVSQAFGPSIRFTHFLCLCFRSVAFQPFMVSVICCTFICCWLVWSSLRMRRWKNHSPVSMALSFTIRPSEPQPARSSLSKMARTLSRSSKWVQSGIGASPQANFKNLDTVISSATFFAFDLPSTANQSGFIPDVVPPEPVGSFLMKFWDLLLFLLAGGLRWWWRLKDAGDCRLAS